MAARTMEDRIATAADPARDFYERAVAAWFASGVEWGRERRVGGGDVLALLRGMRDAGVPERWCVTVRRAIKLAREPLFVMLLLLGGETVCTTQIRMTEPPEAKLCGGVPSYAYDKHTRLGLQALKRFAKENEAVAAVLNEHVADFRGMAALNIAAFYTDGALVDVRLDWLRSDEIEQRGICSDIMQAGAPPFGVAPLREVIASNLAHLNQIRADLIQRARKDRGDAGGPYLG